MAKAEKANTALAVINDDSTAIDTLDILKAELKSLKSITETAYKTTGMVEGFPISIQNETKIENLVRMQASVQGRNEAYNKAQEVLTAELGESLSVPVFKVNGATPADIQSDIVLRIRVISVEDRKKELESLVEEGKKFLTQKDQFTLYQQKVARLAKKA
jgi:hypothetical protein